MGQGNSVPAVPEGARSKKIYVHYEEEEEQQKTLKLTLPKKWMGCQVAQLKTFILDHLSTKQPNEQQQQWAAAAEFYLRKSDGQQQLREDEVVHDVLSDRCDLQLVRGGPLTYKFRAGEKSEEEKKKIEQEKMLVQCKNFGCKSKFNPSATAADNVCHYHSAPPTFHDTKKGWGCCDTKMVYDWDDFEKIPTCMVGVHSSEQMKPKPDEKKETQSTTEPAVKKEVAPPPVMKSIDDFNKAPPAPVVKPKAAPVARDDGKARCVNFGCQKEYFVDINNDKSCCHHKSAPVFHDSGKYWSCCPKNVKYDFDEFLKIPGCVVSAHADKK